VYELHDAKVVMGEEKQGNLLAMFTMMKYARSQVALPRLKAPQNASYQEHSSYARRSCNQRHQQRCATARSKKQTQIFASTLDVKKMLLLKKALTRLSEQLAMAYAQQMD